MSAGFLPDRQYWSHSATDFSSRLRAKIAGLFEGPILSQEGGYYTRAEPIAHSGPPNLGVRLVWISWNVSRHPDITEHAGDVSAINPGYMIASNYQYVYERQ
jgi:hypothetical protein